MPVLDRPVSEAMTHIIHPITEELTKRVLTDIGVLNIFDDQLYYKFPDSVSSITSGKQHTVKLNRDRCDVSIEPMFNPAAVKWDTINFKSAPAYSIAKQHRYEDYSIFHDQRADILVQEQLVPCSVKLEVVMQFKSKEYAVMALSALQARYYQSSMIMYESMAYSYPVPPISLIALYRLFKLRDFDPELSFKQYLQMGSADNISYEANRTGTDAELTVNKNSDRLMVEVTINNERPEAELINKIPNYWTVSFTIDFQFMRPDVWRMYYPVVVDNKLVPAELCPVMERQHPTASEMVTVDRAHQAYIISNLTDKYVQSPVSFPIYDDWTVPVDNNPVKRFGYKEFFLGAFTIDDDPDTGEPLTKIDLLNDFPEEYALHPVIVDSLKIQGSKSFYHDGLFNISVYTNDDKVDPDLLSISHDLVVTIKSTIKYKRYHIVLSEQTELRYLDPKLIPILLKYDDFFSMTLIRHIDELIRKGELVKKNGIIYTGRDRYVRAVYDGSYDAAGGEASDLPTITDGLEYADLEGYDEVTDTYLFSRKGYPILSNQGGLSGFNSPFRIGSYVISPKRN